MEKGRWKKKKGSVHVSVLSAREKRLLKTDSTESDKHKFLHPYAKNKESISLLTLQKNNYLQSISLPIQSKFVSLQPVLVKANAI